jgi:putative transposase
MSELDRLLSERDKLHNEDRSLQWVKDRLKNLNRKIHQVRARHQNLVTDLVMRVAYDLVTNHDVILLPTFETKQMTQKTNETRFEEKVFFSKKLSPRKRFLRRKTVRGMLGLAHYKFKQTLKWMATKYGNRTYALTKKVFYETL